jgi:hypothetical protein
MNYLAPLRPAADRAVPILPWVVSRDCSYGFLWAGSIIQKDMRKNNPTPAYSPVSDRRRPTALVEVNYKEWRCNYGLCAHEPMSDRSFFLGACFCRQETQASSDKGNDSNDRQSPSVLQLLNRGIGVALFVGFAGDPGKRLCSALFRHCALRQQNLVLTGRSLQSPSSLPPPMGDL